MRRIPSLATEVTLQPLERFPLDAAILFSDILTVPDAMGLGLAFAEGEGPRFARTAARRGRDRRARACPTWARFATCSMRCARSSARCAGACRCIGFAGSPFTLACYMIEGGGSAISLGATGWRRRALTCCSASSTINAQAVTAYLDEQIAAGADAVMLFDTWGGLLTSSAYRAFSLASMRTVLAALKPDADGRRVPSIVFTKGGGQWLDDLANCGASGVGLDWTVDLADARRRVGARVALQGNLDPLVLLTDAETVAREGAAVVRAAGPAPGHIFNLGHGIVPATPPEHVAALVEAVHRESRRMRAVA